MRFFRVHRGRSPEAALLQQTVAIGTERTLRQDPAFGFRMIADIACKALSPAINDPTTATLALDQIHRLLRWVGGRRLGVGIHRDAAGQVRLIYRSPDWEDFVRLGLSETRRYARQQSADRPQTAQLLDNLIDVLPASRSVALREESRLLALAVEQQFTDSRERQSAEIGDYQGLGCPMKPVGRTSGAVKDG